MTDGDFTHSFYSWDIGNGNITTLRATLGETESFNNGEIAGSSTKPLNWNTSAITSFEFFIYQYQFFHTNNLDPTDPNYDPFDGRGSYNQPMNTKEVTIHERTYTAWDTSSVTHMGVMFQL